MQAATEYFFLTGFDRPVNVKTLQLIRLEVSRESYIKLNTDGNSIGNPRMASACDIPCNSSREWISGFSLNMGFATNNIAKLGAIIQGLLLAWELGFKYIQLEIDSTTILSWLTIGTSNYPPNVFPLIYDCRSLTGSGRFGHATFIVKPMNVPMP